MKDKGFCCSCKKITPKKRLRFGRLFYFCRHHSEDEVVNGVKQVVIDNAKKGLLT